MYNSFEEWKNRPVYVVQCYTCSLVHEMGIWVNKFRVLPPYRDEVTSRVRNLVSKRVRLERAIAKTLYGSHRFAKLASVNAQ